MANVGYATGIPAHESDRWSDRSLAYALFRLTFGVNIMMRGVVRIALGRTAFITYMLTQFKDVPVMPPAFLIPFATVLPYIESVVGLMLVLGFKTRAALIVGSLMITALTFGTMLRNDFTIAWLQLTYAIVFFLLMAFRSWNLLSVDGMK
jgi:thiosulfate dehydrogenase [quinone] large subunit